MDNNDGDKIGFIVMDGSRTLVGTLSGNTREVLYNFPINHPKYGRGPYDLWHAHIRRELHLNYLRKTARLAKLCLINHSTSQPIVSGLILAITANLKTELSKTRMFEPGLKILNVVEVSCGGENGFNQAIELSAEIVGMMAHPPPIVVP